VCGYAKAKGKRKWQLMAMESVCDQLKTALLRQLLLRLDNLPFGTLTAITVWQHLSKISRLLYIRNTKFEICYSDLITSSSCSKFIKPRK